MEALGEGPARAAGWRGQVPGGAPGSGASPRAPGPGHQRPQRGRQVGRPEDRRRVVPARPVRLGRACPRVRHRPAPGAAAAGGPGRRPVHRRGAEQLLGAPGAPAPVPGRGRARRPGPLRRDRQRHRSPGRHRPGLRRAGTARGAPGPGAGLHAFRAAQGRGARPPGHDQRGHGFRRGRPAAAVHHPGGGSRHQSRVRHRGPDGLRPRTPAAGQVPGRAGAGPGRKAAGGPGPARPRPGDRQNRNSACRKPGSSCRTAGSRSAWGTSPGKGRTCSRMPAGGRRSCSRKAAAPWRTRCARSAPPARTSRRSRERATAWPNWRPAWSRDRRRRPAAVREGQQVRIPAPEPRGPGRGSPRRQGDRRGGWAAADPRCWTRWRR